MSTTHRGAHVHSNGNKRSTRYFESPEMFNLRQVAMIYESILDDIDLVRRDSTHVCNQGQMIHRRCTVYFDYLKRYPCFILCCCYILGPCGTFLPFCLS